MIWRMLGGEKARLSKPPEEAKTNKGQPCKCISTMWGDPVVPGVKGTNRDREVAPKAEHSVKKALSCSATDYLYLMEEDNLLLDLNIATHGHMDHILWVSFLPYLPSIPSFISGSMFLYMLASFSLILLCPFILTHCRLLQDQRGLSIGSQQ